MGNSYHAETAVLRALHLPDNPPGLFRHGDESITNRRGPNSGPGPGGRIHSSSNHHSSRNTGGSAEAPAQAESPTITLVEEPAPTDAPPEITPEFGMPGPAGMDDTGSLISQLSSDEQSCLSENGDPKQLLMLMNSPELASPQERDILAGCLENETLLNIFLKGFTDQAGPLSSDTSACIGAGFQNLDLRAMMLTSPEEPEDEAGIAQVMAGLIIVLACLDEPEWQAASQPLDLPPDGREAMQCVMNKLGGPEGIVASLESKEGEPPLALFNAAAECGLTIMMMEEPPG